MHDHTRRRRPPAISRALHYVRKEPVAFQGVIQAGLAALVGFGVIAMTSEQTGLLLALTAAVLGLLARQQVTPKSKVPSDLK